jgi:hypothetical protein
MNLSRKLPLAIAMALLFTLAAGFFGLWSAHRSLGVFHGDVQRHMAAERLAAEVEGHFKTQVQEWKNVLLRGSDNALREQHWKGFLADERAVQDKTAALLALVDDASLREIAQGFVAQHRKMAEGYRVGLDKFEATGFDPSVGDMAVRGVDREPAELLAQLKAGIAAQSKEVADAAFSSWCVVGGIVNSKVQRPSVCNALETLLVHESISAIALPKIAAELEAKGVTIHGCEKTLKLISGVAATDADWSTEYYSLDLSVKVVADLDQALAHISKYSTRHTESIVTEDQSNAECFLQEVDAAVVMVNASTRFTDGSEFGFGAEVGISTQKLHARGPMGLRELTSSKWLVRGNGQVRD